MEKETLEDLFLLSSSLTIVFPSRFSPLLLIGPPYLPTRASSKPTAQIIIPVLRHFLAQCGHRTCPAPRTSIEPTAQYF